ncbi:MAG: M20/M25/M40 family metallo-hydrolase [Luteibaculaceae bacterium]
MKKLLSIVAFVLVAFVGFSQDNTLANQLNAHVSFLAADSLEGRGLGTKGIEYARDYIENAFQEAGIQPFNGNFRQEFTFRQNIVQVNAANIMGFLEGNDPVLKNEYIVIGAHYDHIGFRTDKKTGERIIFNGADDNASGTATVIELAKYFVANGNHKRSIIFVAFDAEESGLIGAKHMVSEPPVPIEQIKLMFSLDMVGMLSKYNGIDLKGIALLEGGLEVLKPIAKAMEINLKNTSAEVEQFTDTAPFGEAGIPAVHAFTGLVSPYHKPEDTAEKLDYEGMATITNFLAEGITALANQPELKLTPRAAQAIKEGGVKKTFYFAAVAHNGSGHQSFSDEFFVSKRRYNIALGLQTQARLSKNFRIVNELLIDYNGSQTSLGNFRRISTTIPLMLQISTSDAEFARLFVNLGMHYRHHFYGTLDGESDNFFDTFRDNELGISGSIGFEANNKIQVFYTFRRGLDPVNKTGSNVHDINHLIGVGFRL